MQDIEIQLTRLEKVALTCIEGGDSTIFLDEIMRVSKLSSGNVLCSDLKYV